MGLNTIKMGHDGPLDICPLPAAAEREKIRGIAAAHNRMPLRRLAPHLPIPRRFLRSLNPSPAMSPAADAAHLATAADPDEDLCSSAAGSAAAAAAAEEVAPARPLPPPPVSAEERIERAWAHWRRLGSPRLTVAPMVDNSELPFRMLCRRYGADAAYTPMLHSRIFSENEKYRSMEFTTCKVTGACLPVGTKFKGSGTCLARYCNAS